MKIKKILLPLGIIVLGNYYLYKKYDEVIDDNDHIDRCRNKLIAEGYDVVDSYTLNLIKNNYLMFYFSDNGINYEVKYNKEENKIQYIREVE